MTERRRFCPQSTVLYSYNSICHVGWDNALACVPFAEVISRIFSFCFLIVTKKGSHELPARSWTQKSADKSSTQGVLCFGIKGGTKKKMRTIDYKIKYTKLLLFFLLFFCCWAEDFEGKVYVIMYVCDRKVAHDGIQLTSGCR